MKKALKVGIGSNMHHIIEIKVERGQMYEHNGDWCSIVDARPVNKTHFEVILETVC